MNVIIVLGNSREPVRRLRVDAAVNYYRSNPDSVFIFCGAGGTAPSEAQKMYDYAVGELEIDPEICFIENKSTNTQENIQFALDLIKDNLDLVNTFVICTTTFHLPRAYTIATFILNPYGKVKGISTNEPVTEQQKASEAKAIYNFVAANIG